MIVKYKSSPILWRPPPDISLFHMEPDNLYVCTVFLLCARQGTVGHNICFTHEDQKAVLMDFGKGQKVYGIFVSTESII